MIFVIFLTQVYAQVEKVTYAAFEEATSFRLVISNVLPCSTVRGPKGLLKSKPNPLRGFIRHLAIHPKKGCFPPRLTVGGCHVF